jgi:hypothetical protein
MSEMDPFMRVVPPRGDNDKGDRLVATTSKRALNARPESGSLLLTDLKEGGVVAVGGFIAAAIVGVFGLPAVAMGGAAGAVFLVAKHLVPAHPKRN